MKSVPVIMQMEAVECGAASLSMVLATYGRWESLEDMRVACGVSRDGVSAGDIVKTAQDFGLESNGYSLELDELREDLEKDDFPCILHFDFNHFVVLVGFRGKKAVINDPAGGRVYMTMDELSRRWTGVCLTFKPTDKFKKCGAPVSSLSYIKNRLIGAKQALIFTFLISILTAVISISLPIISQAFADGVLTKTNTEWGFPIVIIMAVLTVIQFIINATSALYNNKINASLAIISTSKFIWHMLFLPMRFFSMRMPGDLVMRIQQATQIPRTLVDKIAPVAVNIAMLIIYALFMIKYSPMLTLMVIVATSLTCYIAWKMSRWQMNKSRRAMRESGKLYNTTMSGIENIETIKSAGAELGFFQKWANAYTVATNMRIEINRLSAYVGLIPGFLMSLASNLILICGCSLILKGNMTIGMLMAFQGFMGNFTSPMNDIVDAVTSLITMRSEMERVEDVFRSDPDVEALTEDKRDLGTGKLLGDIELRNVTFGYSKMRPPLIKDFSFHLHPGQSIAFVGASGCGKSTLASIICGLYAPWEGEVLYDGMPISKINRATFTSSVSIISQSASFFEGTIADNIKLWDNSIEDFAMILACRDARIHDEIIRRDGAYQADVASGGTNFSGGQRQRLDIAAALVKEPTVLILDEATSALDATTEAEVMKAIRDLNVTLIVVAHRLSTIRDCDEIVVFDHGKVIERGNHEQLVANKGHYYNLLQD